MKEVTLSELLEGQTYLIESNEIIKTNLGNDKGCHPMLTEFEEVLAFEYRVLATVVKIESPFHIVRSGRGKQIVRLSDDYRYYQPSEDFLKKSKNDCTYD